MASVLQLLLTRKSKNHKNSKMKYFLGLLAIAVVTYSSAAHGDHGHGDMNPFAKMIKPLINVCKNQEGATDADANPNMGSPATPKQKCLFACLLEKLGIVKFKFIIFSPIDNYISTIFDRWLTRKLSKRRS